MTVNADPNITPGAEGGAPEDPEVQADTVSKEDYEALQEQSSKHEQMAKFGTDVFERLSVLRDSNPQAYEIVKAAMENREIPAQQSAAAGTDPYGTIDDEMLGAIQQIVAQTVQSQVGGLKESVTRMGMDSQIANLKAKYGADAVAANHDDLVRAIDSNPGILKQPNGLETLFKAVDHDKVTDRVAARKLEEENKEQERLLRRRGLPAGNLGGRTPEPKLESFEDMWEYAKQQLRAGPLED